MFDCVFCRLIFMANVSLKLFDCLCFVKITLQIANYTGAQVSIARVGDVSLVSSQIIDSLSFPFNDTSHRFSVCCGKNVILKNNNLTASRNRHYCNALAFSSSPIDVDEIFEV